MDDDCLSNDVLHTKTVCDHTEKRPPARAEKRWQIPRVLWMGLPSRIVVAPRFPETASAAASSFMDVKPEKARIIFRQALDLRHNQNAVPVGKKPNPSAQVGICVICCNKGNRPRGFAAFHLSSPRAFYECPASDVQKSGAIAPG